MGQGVSHDGIGGDRDHSLGPWTTGPPWSRPRPGPGPGPKSSQSQPKVNPKSSQSHPKVIPKTSQSYPKAIPKSSPNHTRIITKVTPSRPQVGPKLAQSHPNVIQESIQKHDIGWNWGRTSSICPKPGVIGSIPRIHMDLLSDHLTPWDAKSEYVHVSGLLPNYWPYGIPTGPCGFPIGPLGCCWNTGLLLDHRAAAMLIQENGLSVAPNAHAGLKGDYDPTMAAPRLDTREHQNPLATQRTNSNPVDNSKPKDL